MIIRTVLDLQGVARGGTAFEDDLFLLTGNGRVLAARSELTEPLPGRNFFDTFRAKDSEKHELFRLMNEFGDAPAFFRCTGKTVLFLTAYYAETGFFAALVPRNPLTVFTDSPGALTESFPSVYFTSGVKKRNLPPSEQQYMVISRYLALCGRSEITPLEDDITCAFYNSSVALIDTVARQTGCTIDYNLSGLGIRPSQNPAFGRFGGLLYLLALVVVRAAKNRVLQLSIEPIDPEAPLYVAEFELSDPNDPLPEFDGFGTLADSFGFYADYYRDHARYILRWSVGHRDLSRQGMKHPSVYPVAKMPYPIHPFPEENKK